jgi:hypothetical protein
MILSTKPMPPLPLPCTCGCSQVFEYPRRIRHIVKLHWRYKLQEMRNGNQWGGVYIDAPHYFQPRHRRAQRYWRDTRPNRRRNIRPRCLTRSVEK